jgi:hypothetical protein
MNDTGDGCGDMQDASAPAEALPPPPDWNEWADGLGLDGMDRHHLGWLIQCERLWGEAVERNRALVDVKDKRPEPLGSTTLSLIGIYVLGGEGVVEAIQRWVIFADAETVRANHAEEELASSTEWAKELHDIILTLRADLSTKLADLSTKLADLATIIEHTDGPTAAQLVRQLSERRIEPVP